MGKNLLREPTMQEHSFYDWVRISAFCVMVITLVTFAAAQDYLLDYSAIGIGGGQSETTNYEVIGLLKADGVDSEPQTSDDYSVTTTTGLKEEPQTRVDDWMLY